MLYAFRIAPGSFERTFENIDFPNPKNHHHVDPNVALLPVIWSFPAETVHTIGFFKEKKRVSVSYEP